MVECKNSPYILGFFMSLSVKWSKYIPADKKPTTKQLAFLSLPHMEAFYGGAASGGKGLLPQCKIITPFGERELGSLRVGDSICATDGTVSTILNVWNRGVQPLYKLTWSTGQETICDQDHIWLGWSSRKSRKVSNKRTNGEESARKWTTKEIFEKFSEEGSLISRGNFLIPLISEPVKYNVAGTLKGKGNFIKRDLPAYVLGVLLGDGCLSGNHLCYVSADEQIATEVNNELGVEISPYNTEKKCKVYPLPTKWHDYLVTIGIRGKRAWEKFIPKIYKLGTVEERWALLQGLMDTDGWGEADGRCGYCSTSEQLADDVMEVARSLGAYCTKTSKISTYSYKGEKLKGRRAYTIYIKFKDNTKAFRLQRKKDAVEGYSPNSMSVRLESIERFGEDSTICIEVSNPNSLFIIDGFIVTHNSEALLFGALAWCDTPGFKGLIIRRTFTDMLLPSSILSRCKKWLEPFIQTKEVKYDKSQHTFYFPSGAELAFGYLKSTGSEERYQSSEYNYIAFDELTHFLEDEYRYLFSRLRTTTELEHIPSKVRAGANPGGQGHIWVKERFGIMKDVTTGKWYGTNPEAPFVPATVFDNPYVNKDYVKALEKLPKLQRERLMNGDWDATDQAIFDNSWFDDRYTIKSNGIDSWYHLLNFNGRQVIDHRNLMIFTTIDCAASQATGVKGVSYIKDKQPSWSVISTWGLTNKHDLLWLDCQRFQTSIPELVNRIGENQKAWHPLYNIIEKNGPGEGVYQIADQRGIPVKPIHTPSDKIINSTAANLRAEQGKIWLPRFSPWLRTVENEVFSWTGSKNEVNDIVDTLSNAANEAMEISVGYERDYQFRRGLRRAVPTASRGGVLQERQEVGGRERLRLGAMRIQSLRRGGGKGFSSGLDHLR